MTSPSSGRVAIDVDLNVDRLPARLQSGLRGAVGTANTVGKGIGLAIAGGVAIAGFGLRDVIKIGTEYQGNLNEIQAVSGATADQMRRIGAVATQLGSDMSLPATSAADAASAMLELAKGGLSVEQAMTAAKGTLQLAAAAQIDAASAAEIQSAALNQFGLDASSASHVADVLANTANAASGSITDIAGAMKYVGPVARSLKVDIDDTATAIGLLANNGIQSEQAGTSLRAILASLAAPSKVAAKAMKALNIEAFDQKGHFVGLRAITEQLSTAKGKLTDAEFANASATAFGNESLSAVNALANSGTVAFDNMATSVSKQGGAADVAAAKTKGLGGAVEGFKSQVETLEIGIFQEISPTLEKATRSAANFVSNATPAIVNGIGVAVSVAEGFGPAVVKGLASHAGDVLHTAREVFSPLGTAAKDIANEGLNIAIVAFKGFGGVVREAEQPVEDLVTGVGHLAEGFARAGGPMGAAREALQLAYNVTKGIVTVIGPVVSLVGDLVGAFGDLPGPIQSAAFAVLALKVGPSIIGKLKDALSGAGKEADGAEKKTGLFGRTVSTVTAPVRFLATGVGGVVKTVKQFNDESRVQQQLLRQTGLEMGRARSFVDAYRTSTIPAVAATRGFTDQMSAIRAAATASGAPISAFGAALQTITERVPALSSARDAFNNAATGATRFGKTAGTAAAAGSLLKSGATGLVSVLGGPLGLAIGAASIGLGMLADKNEAAAEAARAHQSSVDGLAVTLRNSNGAITQQVRAQQAQNLLSNDQTRKAIEISKQYGITLEDVNSASLGNVDAQKKIISTLQGVANGQDKMSQGYVNTLELIQFFNTKVFTSFSEAVKQNRELADATGTTTSVLGQLSAAASVLADPMANASDKANALRTALDLLTGGATNARNAQAQFFQTVDGLSKKLTEAKGRILDAKGALDVTTERGRLVNEVINQASSSWSTYATSQIAAGKSAKDVQAGLQGMRDALVQQLLPAFGNNKKKVDEFLDSVGLIPSDITVGVSAPGMLQAQQAAQILSGKLISIPDDKTIKIKGITKEAEDKLAVLGFKVTHAPDGTVTVTSDDAKALKGLADLLAVVDGSSGTVGIKADPQPAYDEHGGLLQVIDQSHGTVSEKADTAPAFNSHGQFLGTVNQSYATAQGRANFEKAYNAAGGFVGFVQKQNPRMPVAADTKRAQDQIDGFVRRNDGRTIKIGLGTVHSGGLQAAGSILEARRFATGGFADQIKRARPMRGGYADIVPPNSWRIIGDRLRDPEAYIPLNSSYRSRTLLAEAAARMGYDLIRRYASGGVALPAQQSSSPSQAGAPISIVNDITVRENEDAFVAATVLSRNVGWQLRKSSG